MDRYALGRRIHIARKDQGLTGEQLSELCHINATYLRQIESGAKTPSLPVFVTICQQLRVSPHFLLADELSNDESTSVNELFKLLEGITPRQQELVSIMIRSALSTLDTL